MSDYKIIGSFSLDGTKILNVKMVSTGTCCMMEEWQYDRLIIEDMAFGKKCRIKKKGD